MPTWELLLWAAIGAAIPDLRLMTARRRAAAYVTKSLLASSFAFSFYLGISVVLYIQPHGPFEAPASRLCFV